MIIIYTKMATGCADFLLWKLNVNGGCGPYNKNVILNQNVVDKVTEYIVSNRNTLTEVVKIGQNINIVNKGQINCPDGLKISQNAQVMLKIQSGLKDTQLINIRDAVENAIKNSTTQTNKEIVGFLASEPGGHNINDITNIIINKTRTTLTIDRINQIIADTQVIQNNTIYNEGIISGKECTITQDALINQFAYATLDAVSNASLSDTIVNKTINDVIQHLETQSKGLESIIGWIVLAIIGVVIIVIVIGLVYYFVVVRKKVK